MNHAINLLINCKMHLREMCTWMSTDEATKNHHTFLFTAKLNAKHKTHADALAIVRRLDCMRRFVGGTWRCLVRMFVSCEANESDWGGVNWRGIFYFFVFIRLGRINCPIYLECDLFEWIKIKISIFCPKTSSDFFSGFDSVNFVWFTMEKWFWFPSQIS